jgi:hypothetical protein
MLCVLTGAGGRTATASSALLTGSRSDAVSPSRRFKEAFSSLSRRSSSSMFNDMDEARIAFMVGQAEGDLQMEPPPFFPLWLDRQFGKTVPFLFIGSRQF